MFGADLVLGFLGKLGVKGATILICVAAAGYFWWMWDIEKKKVIELHTSIGKMEVINATTLATVDELTADNLHKDELHAEDVKNINDELGDRDERIIELQKRNKFLFEKAVKKPFETGDVINANYGEWMCKLYSGKDCASATNGGENLVPPASVGDAEADRDTDDNSHN